MSQSNGAWPGLSIGNEFGMLRVGPRVVGTPLQRRAVVDLPKGSAMKRFSYRLRVGRSSASRSESPAPFRGFTLVEMLVVIAIISILASLVTAAAVVARRRAKIAVAVTELKQLEMACQAYKEKFGEYPPDFFQCNTDAGRSIVLRHLARAFPRYQPPLGTGSTVTEQRFNGFLSQLQTQTNWGFPASGANQGPNFGSNGPGAALLFWLGGRPNWRMASDSTPITPDSTGTGDDAWDPTKPVTGFSGFSADPTAPFGNATSRTQPFFEFDPTRVGYYNGQLRYWHSGAEPSTDNADYCCVYFRAENNAYTINNGATVVPKLFNNVRPAVDSRLSNTTASSWVWVNPRTFQIFCAGADARYGLLSAPVNWLLFPSGDNYAPETYDDITNFSGGTLEDAIP